MICRSPTRLLHDHRRERIALARGDPRQHLLDRHVDDLREALQLAEAQVPLVRQVGRPERDGGAARGSRRARGRCGRGSARAAPRAGPSAAGCSARRAGTAWPERTCSAHRRRNSVAKMSSTTPPRIATRSAICGVRRYGSSTRGSAGGTCSLPLGASQGGAPLPRARASRAAAAASSRASRRAP